MAYILFSIQIQKQGNTPYALHCTACSAWQMYGNELQYTLAINDLISLTYVMLIKPLIALAYLLIRMQRFNQY